MSLIQNLEFKIQNLSQRTPSLPKKTVSPSKRKSIPEPTIARLPRYLRSFAEFMHSHQAVISSKELAAVSSINPAQVRKDLAYFGQFGQRGIGYDVKTLDFK